MNDGWIKLHRELLKKAIWKCSNPQHKTILITLLLMANHEESEWEWEGKKFTCNPGQFITSLKSIKKIAGKGITIKMIRNALIKFEKYDFLANKGAMTGRLITIVNWEQYQLQEKRGAKIGAKQGQSRGKAGASNKNVKNDKKVKNTIYRVVFDCWNDEKIIIHKTLNSKIESAINGRLDDGYKEDEITKAIKNYSIILKDSKYKWTYQWTLWAFLQRGFEQFKDWEIASKNYLKKEYIDWDKI